MRKILASCCVVCFVTVAFAFEYNVRQPSDILRPTYHAADTAPGVWTLNVQDALAKAKDAGKCTIVLNTASWWCPYCETAEDLVLKSDAWAEYVRGNGFYLAMLDFPYRGTVTPDQVWKSWHPELGDGWGFKCWLMCPEYLSSIGLTEEEGLDAIMAEYEIQKSLALSSASPVTIKNWRTGEDFSYGKVGYLTFIVFGPDGTELGRTGFPWYNAADVTSSEACEHVIQSLEMLVNGACRLCDDPLSGEPPTDAAQVYNGWLNDEDGKFAGTVQFKTSKKTSKGKVRVSGAATVNGRKTSFRSTTVTLAAGCTACGDVAGGLVEKVRLEKGEMAAEVQFGESGLVGSIFISGEKTYEIAGGGRDVFKAKDAKAKAKAATTPLGTWSVVLKGADKASPSPYARGTGTLSVEMKSKGKASVKGQLGDGTRVNKTFQAIVGDAGVACLPIDLNLYGKRGGLDFVIWFRDGKLFNFTSVSPWVAAGKHPFTAQVTPVSTMSHGMGTVPDEMELTLVGFDPNMTIGGFPLVEDPSFDTVSVNKNKWQGTELTDFTAKCNARTGALSGKMTFFVNRAGKVKKTKGTFSGIVMGGSGYGTVVTKDGSWAVKIAACGGCSD